MEFPASRMAGEQRVSDVALVAGCAARDHSALGALYDRHCDDLTRFVARIVHLDGDEVQDIVQEVFLKAYQAAPTYGGRSSVRTWIWGIGANVAKTAARTAARRRRNESAAGAFVGHTSPQPDVRLLNRELVERLDDALDDLTLDQRMAFVLRDVEGLSGADAAKIMGVPVGTYYRKVHEARSSLRDALRRTE